MYRIRGWLPLLAIGICALPAAAQPFVYVTNQTADVITVINTRDNRVSGRFTLSIGPSGIAISPDGARAYVVHGQNTSFFTVNLANNSIVNGFLLPGLDAANVVVSPNGQRAFVTQAQTGQIAVVNTVTGTTLANLRVGNGPFGLALTPDGSKLYVGNASDHTISVLDAAALRVVGTITPACASPNSLVAAPTGSTMYVGCSGGKSIIRINTDSDAITGTLNLGRVPVNVALSPDGSTGYVTSHGTSTITVFDTATLSVKNTIELPGCLVARCSAFGIALSADGRTAYIAEPTSDRVHVVNTETREIVTSILVDRGPRGVAITPVPRAADVADAKAAREVKQ